MTGDDLGHAFSLHRLGILNKVGHWWVVLIQDIFQKLAILLLGKADSLRLRYPNEKAVNDSAGFGAHTFRMKIGWAGLSIRVAFHPVY